jgi:hypothetical protein
MKREEMIELIADYAGPLGPFREIQEQEDLRNARLAAASFDDVDLLLDILRHPPAIATHPAVQTFWDYAVEETLALLGQRAPQQMLEKIGPLLQLAPTRATAIAVIGSLRQAEGLSLLAPMVDEAGLTTTELVALACAFGEIGDPRARQMLEHMQASPASGVPAVREEIRSALGGSPAGIALRLW